jgi:S-adenosylmethionine/arginine decarboxylase-like enzyme
MKDIFDRSAIKLIESTHTYVVKEAPHLRFTSVTTFIHQFFQPFDADGIAEKLAFTKNAKSEYYSKTKEEILKMWTAIADAGTKTHFEIETWAESYREKVDVLDPAETDKAKHAIEYLEEALEEGMEPFCEMRLYSTLYQLSGTIDLLVRKNPEGLWVMGDWKTNKAIKESGWNGATGIHDATKYIQDANYWHYALQMSLYQYILEKEYGLKIENRYLFHLLPKKTKKHPTGMVIYEMPYLKANVHNMLEYRLKLKEAGRMFEEEDLHKNAEIEI